MAEVGVLNLTIHDNSSTAAQGLEELTGALTHLQTIVSNGLKLSGISRTLNTFANAVSSNSKTLSNIGTFLNAVREYNKAFKDLEGVKFNKQPITDLKDAIGDGIKIGQAGTQIKNLREALGGDWNITNAEKAGEALKFIGEGARSVPNNLSTIAKNISAVAHAFNEYADGTRNIMAAVKGAQKNNVTDEMRQHLDDAARRQKEWFEGGGFATGKRMPLNLQLFGGHKTENWRDTMSGIVESAKEVEKVSSSFDNLREVAEIIKDFRITKTKGTNIEALATAIEHLQSAASDGLRLSTVLSNIQRLNEKAGEIRSSGTVGILHELAEALARVKESAEGLQIQNIKINFGNGRGTAKGAVPEIASAESAVQQAAREVEGTFQNVQSTVHGVAEEIEKVVTSLIEFRSHGESAAEQAERMQRAFWSMFEIASKMRSAFALPWGSMNGLPESGFIKGEGTVSGDDVARIANETRDIIVSNYTIEDSWNDISERIRIAKMELDAYLEGQKQVIFGNESIKGIYEDRRFGPTLAGFYGKDAQWSMIEDISKGTGIGVEDIVNQLYELSNGAVDLRQSLEAASAAGTGTFKEGMDAVAESANPAISKIELLKNKIDYLWGKIELLQKMPPVDEFGRDTGRDNAINDYLLKIGQLNEQMMKLVDNAHKTQDAMAFDGMKANADTLQRDYGAEMVENMVNNYSEIDLLTIKLDGLKQALADDINQNKVDTQQIAEKTMAIRNLADRIEELKQKQEEATLSTVLFGTSWKGLGAGIKALFPTITGLVTRFKSMMIMRTMRYLIRQIAAGLSEGIKNVYYYSQAIGGDFAPAMDSAASALAQMKNSLGAALAPALQALLPYIQMAISAFINLINYVNQFFSLLRGQPTWTRAIQQQTKAYDDNTKKAKQSAKAAKDLLADWDELNIIQSQGGGSGGSGSGKETPDYSKMFEEVSEYSKDIQSLVDGIKERFGDVWGLVKRIGLTILGWKLSNAFAGILGTIGGLVGSGVTIGLVFDLSTIFTNNFLNTGNAGWLIADLLTTLIGGVLTRKMLGKVLGGSLATLAIPLAFSVSAAASLIALVKKTDVTALSEKGVLAALNTALEGGVAGGALLYSLGGYAMSTAIGGGIGGALFTFGATIGIKATADVIDTGAVTSDTIKADFLAAGAIGAGLALSEAVLGGTIATIATVGLGGAIFVLGGLIGLQMIIASQKTTVKWGNYRATKEQIKAFVEDEKNGVFTVNPNTVLSIIDPLIEVRSTAEDGLTTTVNEVKVIAKKISLGISNKEVLADLEKKIFGDEATGSTGLIGEFRETAKAHENIIETSLTLVPITTNDDGSTKELIDRQSEAWKKLTGGMDDLGKELSEHLARAYSDDIDEKTKQMELKTINNLTNMLTNVSTAMLQGEQYELAYQALQDNLGNLSQGAWDDLFGYVDEYKEQIKASYAAAYDEGTRSMGSLVAGLKQDMENELAMADDPNISKTEEERKRHLANAAAYESEYNFWKDQLEARRKGRKDAIDSATDNALNDDVRELIRSSILPLIDTNAVLPQLAADIPAFAGQRLRSTIWKQLFDGAGQDKEGASETVETWLMQLIDNSFGTNASTIERAIRLGFMDYGDVINKEAIDALASEIGIDKQPAAVQKAWNDLINDLVYGGKGKYSFTAPVLDTSGFTASTEEMTDSAKKATDEISEMFASVQDAIYGSKSTKKKEYNEIIADMYANEKLAELKQLLADIETYGVDEAFRRMNGGNNTGANLLRNGTMARFPGMVGVVGAAGTSTDYGGFYRGGYSNNNQEEEQPAETDFVVDVSGLDPSSDTFMTGMTNSLKTANGDVVSELRTMVVQLQRLLNKQWTVQVQPSTAWGNNNYYSNQKRGKVTGEVE